MNDVQYNKGVYIYNVYRHRGGPYVTYCMHKFTLSVCKNSFPAEKSVSNQLLLWH